MRIYLLFICCFLNAIPISTLVTLLFLLFTVGIFGLSLGFKFYGLGLGLGLEQPDFDIGLAFFDFGLLHITDLSATILTLPTVTDFTRRRRSLLPFREINQCICVPKS